MVAALMHQNLVTLKRVAQDGMRVRANAGKSSFRRQASLECCQQEAREQIELLQKLADDYRGALRFETRDLRKGGPWQELATMN